MSYGDNGYAVAESVGKKPRDHGRGRCCELCPNPVNRYATPSRVGPGLKLLLCSSCRTELESIAESPGGPRKKLAKPKRRAKLGIPRGRGGGRPAGKKLIGLARLLEESGHTHAGLAQVSGVSAAYIGELKRLDRGASVETMERLARALGVEVEELMK